MKILHIINDLRSGGAEKLIEELLPLIKKKGIEVDLLLLDDRKNVYEKKIIENGIDINVIPIRRMRSPFNIFFIRKYIIKGKYSVVHVHLFPTNYWTSLASKTILFNRPKFILTEHNTHNKRRKIRNFNVVEKIIYNSFDKVISISNVTQDSLIKWLRPKKSCLEKFSVVDNGVDVDKFKNAQPMTKERLLNTTNEDNTKIICMVGSFTPQKDQLTVIKALEHLTNEFKLVLVGEGPLENDYIEYVKKMKLEDRVEFLGFRNDIQNIYKTVDIVVLSSVWEGFGLVAVEGMSSGRPVVVSDIPGLRDVVSGAGVVFENGNSKALSIIINKLIKNPDYYKSVVEACIKKSNNYEISKMCNEYIQAYQKAIF